MTTAKDIIAEFAITRYRNKDADELLEEYLNILKINKDASKEEQQALKKPYWSLVYKIAIKNNLMWEKEKRKKQEKKNKQEQKKEEETKPKKEKSN